MKLIIAGTRTLVITNEKLKYFIKELNLVDKITEVVCGEATGIDQCGKRFAIKAGIKVKSFPARWLELGRKAGPMRNYQMACYADQLLLIWDGKSKGSQNMKNEMNKQNKPVLEVIFN